MERQLEHILEELQNLHRKMDDLRKIETPKTESNEIQEIAAGPEAPTSAGPGRDVLGAVSAAQRAAGERDRL